MHIAVGQERLIMDRGRDVIGKGQIVGGQDADNARGCADFCQIELGDGAMGHVRQAKAQMQAVGGHGDVIDVTGSARDMQGGRIVGQGFGDAHGVTSNTLVGTPFRSWK